MSSTRTPDQVLAEIAAIKQMERGSITPVKRYTGYRFFTHNTYESGESHTRYVRKEDVAELRKLLQAHKHFKTLVQEYEELIVQRTRRQRKAKSATPRRRTPQGTRCRSPESTDGAQD